MKKIIEITIIFAIIFGLRADYVLSQSAMTTQKKTEVAIRMPLTLSDCYRLALAESENIAIDADQIKIVEAHFLEALSIIMPHVSFISVDAQQQAQADPTDVANGFQSLKYSARNFNVTQTLFSGFKAIAAIKGTKYERGQRTNEKIRAEQLLLGDVANAFYLLIEEREDLKALGRIAMALDNRVKELVARAKLGKSRPSEIVNAKAQYYGVMATIEQVQNEEAVVRQLLEFLVGGPVQEVWDEYKFPNKIKPKEYYLLRASSRPDVEATKFAWQVAKENIRVADSDFLPNVGVSADYYTQRTGLNEGVNWDVLLTVTVPIFEGTEVLGRSKEANLLADQSRLTYHRTNRQAPYDIEAAYIDLISAMEVRNTLRKAYTTARANAHMQIRDYDRRLVNNLDVLAAIQTLENAERSYIGASYEAKRRYWQLRIAVGQSGTESLDDAF